MKFIRFVPGERPNPDVGEIIAAPDYLGVLVDEPPSTPGRRTDMQKYIERGIATVFAVTGGWLVAAGVVTPEGWDAATTEAVIPLAGVVTVAVYGFVNWMTQKIAGAWG